MAIKRTGVVGCGAMGTGIAQLCAAAGYDVVVVDADEAQLERGLARIKSGLEREAERERLTQEQLDRALAGLTGSQRLSDVADVDIVVEAIIEEIGPKRELFAQLGEVCSDDTVLASNTSSLSISELAAASGRPGSVVGLHFFNPPTVLRLVELTTTVSFDARGGRARCRVLRRDRPRHHPGLGYAGVRRQPHLRSVRVRCDSDARGERRERRGH